MEAALVKRRESVARLELRQKSLRSFRTYFSTQVQFEPAPPNAMVLGTGMNLFSYKRTN